MVDIGDCFSNPVTRERFVMRATSASTDGQYCEFDLHLGVGATLGAAHAHPGQIESVSLLSSNSNMHVGRLRRHVEAGEEVVVPAGTGHAWAMSPMSQRTSSFASRRRT